MVLPYEKIFSRVRNKITDPKEMSLDENDLIEIYTERLHSVAGNQRVRRKFTTLSLDDEIQELTFELEQTVDEMSDEDFVIEVFTLGIVIEWLQKEVDSVLYTYQMIGGKEEKKLVDNYKPMVSRLASMKVELNKKLRDYGYYYNDYIRDSEVKS